MNNTNWFTWAVLVVVIGGGIWWWSTTPKDSRTENNTTAASEFSSDKTSIKDLVASGKPQQCTFNYNENGQISSGTIVTANSKMRGDFAVSGEDVEGGEMKGHMIMTSDQLYVWTDTMDIGFKFATDQSSQANSGLDLEKQVDYSCKNWTQDSSKFTLPAGITFQTLGSASLPTM